MGGGGLIWFAAMPHQTVLSIDTRPRSFSEITDAVRQSLAGSGVHTGLCHLFLRHTSASLLLTENADADVRGDLERWAARLAPDGDPVFRHAAEGPDDMAAHARTVLAGCELTLPVREGQLALGTWQGVYVWEHRQRPHRREIVVTLLGA
jgi:secondary thiamine-phosphate synthase enzyme